MRRHKLTPPELAQRHKRTEHRMAEVCRCFVRCIEWYERKYRATGDSVALRVMAEAFIDGLQRRYPTNGDK